MKKYTAAISFVTVLCFILVTWIPCQAADNALYVCKNNKTGAPRLVKSPTLCKKTEYLVTITSGTQGPQGIQGPQGPQGLPGGIGVYDANNQYLGTLIQMYSDSEGGEMDIYIPALKRVIRIKNCTYCDNPGDIAWEESFYGLFYESNNCTGQAYWEYSPRAVTYVRKDVPGEYYIGNSLVSRELIFLSKKENGACESFSQPVTSSEYFNFGTVEAIQVNLPFTLPVALPLHFD